MPVNHWKQAVCYKCGHARFEVDLHFEDDPDDTTQPGQPQHATRLCVRCREVHDVLDPEGLEDLPHCQPAVCLCEGREFEVIGVTTPSSAGNPDSAWWFHLGLRCVGCGCLGEYALWLERYNDWRELLALL
jgi:hypothetical protein